MQTEILTKRITKETAADLNIPNEPFELIGKMVPSLQNGQWHYDTTFFDETTTMVFPDEDYDFEKMQEQFVAIGAYVDGKCAGIALLEHQMFKYFYLSDLKVNQDFRGLNIGSALIEASKKEAKALGYHGIYTIGQDNNLKACLFYLKNGMEIGGVNTHVYKGTNQSEKTNIYFYEK